MPSKKPSRNMPQKERGKHRPNTGLTKVKPRIEKRFAKVLRSRPLTIQRVHSIAKQIYAEYHWKSNATHVAPEKAVNAMSEALLNLYAHAINVKQGQTITARQLANAVRLMKITSSPTKPGIEKTRKVSEKLANGKTRALLENLEKIAFEQAGGRLLENYKARITKMKTEPKQTYWKDSTGRKRKIPFNDLAKLVEFASYKTATQLHEANGVLAVWLGKK